MKKKLLNELKFLTVNFILAPLLGLTICWLEALQRIKIRNFNRFPQWEEKLIVVSNHPALLEPVILPVMGFPWMNFPWIFSPLWQRIRPSLNWFRELQREFSLSKKLILVNLPDKKNFYDPLYMNILQGINIPVDRGNKTQARISTVFVLKRILENGGRVLIFPEGTRTFKTIKATRFITKSGKELGKLKDGAGWLALKTGAKILPIWVEGTDKVLPNNKFFFPRLWHSMTIKIGNPFLIRGNNRQEATLEIAKALLELAGENNKKG